jgi:hypothetical protein
MEERDQEDRTAKRRVLDLSVIQVSASALAAIVGAVLASELNVYGTVIGAAVVSVGATCGGAVFQHVFRRTGEEIRSRVPAATVSKPGGGPTPVTAAARPTGAEDRESVTTYRSGRRLYPRSWKGYALLTGLVFVLAMGVVTAVERVADKPLAAIVRNESGSGTSLGGGSVGNQNQNPDPAQTPSGQPSGGASTDPSSTPSSTATPDPTTTPSHTPSGGTSSSADPTPSGSAPTGGGSTSPGAGYDAATTPPSP